MRFPPSAFIATALVGAVACSDVKCFENEEKVGNTCYPVRTTATADAAAATASDGGPSGDSSIGISKLDGAVTLDGAFTQDASGAPTVPPVSDGPTADAAPGPAAPGPGERDAAVSVPPKADEADAATAPAPDAASTTPPDAGPPPKCGGGPVNACGGCDVLAHKVDEACSNGGVGVCAQPGAYKCMGETTICNAPPATPGVEICDTLDNDCDGMKDEGGVCPPPAKIVGIAAGDQHACANLSDQTVMCWGANSKGQLGLPASARELPHLVPGLTSVVEVAAGDLHTCVRHRDGTVTCFGDSTNGQFGNGSWGVANGFQVVPGITDATSIASGIYMTCVTRTNGTVSCWGQGMIPNSNVPITIEGISKAGRVAISGFHACVLLTSGGVDCWGHNEYGQLGDGTSRGGASTGAVAVALGSYTATAVAVGRTHSCTLMKGAVECWGLNSLGQLGLGTAAVGASAAYLTPTPLPGLSGVQGLTAGGGSTCALLTDKSVSCWGRLGDQNTGQLNFMPTAIPGVAAALSVSGGNSFSCALLADGSASCWGNNNAGQLGTDTVSFSFSGVSPQPAAR